VSLRAVWRRSRAFWGSISCRGGFVKSSLRQAWFTGCGDGSFRGEMIDVDFGYNIDYDGEQGKVAC
jgi:hypothetical protein